MQYYGAGKKAKKKSGGLDPMAKKRATSKSKYFWKALYVNSIPSCISHFKEILSCAQSTNLSIHQEQQTLSQEALLSALFLYMNAKLQSHGTNKAKWLEKELGPAMEEVSRLVATEMKEREKLRLDASPGGTSEPEGFTKGKPGGKSSSPRPPKKGQ